MRRTTIVGAILLAMCVLLHARFGTYHAFAPSGHAVGLDDAFITFRYAASLAAGDGLVFNPGERVEGYSNLLYTLVMAAVTFAAGVDRMYAASIAINLVFSMAVLVIIGRTLQRRAGPAAGSIGMLLFAVTPPVWIWTGAGLETAMFILAIAGAWSLADDDSPRGVWMLAACCSALLLIRIDGFIPVAVVIVWLAVSGRGHAALRVGGAAALTLAAATAWRLSYYGYPLSNTYYAKYDGAIDERLQSAGRGLWVLVRLFNFGLHAAILAAGAAAAVTRQRLSSVRWLEIGIGLAAIAHYVLAGGDDLGDRFVAPAIVMAVIIVSAWASELPRRTRTFAVPALVAISLASLATDPRLYPRREKYDFLVELGQWLEREPRDRVIAVAAAGKIPFYSGLQTIDMLGLTDARIAHSPVRAFRVGHSKYDPDYVLSRQPDVIVTEIDTALNGAWGLSRDVYARHGYRLDQLVNTRAEARAPNIRAAAALDDESVRALVRDGFTLGVLRRAP